MSTPLAPAPCAITALSATGLSKAIHSKQLSCVEVMQATLNRIGAVNPTVNAIVSLRHADALLAQARAHDAMLARGESMGWMHGMPQAIKDLAATVDAPTTMGSPLLRNNRPAEDALMVRRMKAAGCIVIGKTNVPQFGLGSHTFNPVFGATRNAFDVSKTAGGSSGGSAVALATHMVAVADGSDFMGSLRNPAGWNNVMGMRPSQGRVPMWPAADVWLAQLGTEGPMGRNLFDVARLLAVQAGHDARCPLSLQQPFDLAVALEPLGDAARSNLRVGWLGDLAGNLPMEPGVLDICEQALRRAGVQVEPLATTAALGFDAPSVWQAWLVWRALLVASRLQTLMTMPNARAHMKPEASWEADRGALLTGAQMAQASSVRSSFYAAMCKLLDRFDLLALPSAQVWPFDIKLRHPTEITTTKGVVHMDTYHRWMESSIYATFAGLPAISVPAGFGSAGLPYKESAIQLPMGLQLIGKPNGDEALLRAAQAFERS